MPGTDTTLAIGMPYSFGIFDVTGNTGSFRPEHPAGTYQGLNPLFASPTELYAYDSQTTGAEFYRYSINVNGLTLIDGTTLDGLGGFSGGFQQANSLVYGDGGGIINPTTTPPIAGPGHFPLIDFYGSGGPGSGVAVVADPSLQKDFLLLGNYAGTLAYGLARYDLNTYLPEAVLPDAWRRLGVYVDHAALRSGWSRPVGREHPLARPRRSISSCFCADPSLRRRNSPRKALPHTGVPVPPPASPTAATTSRSRSPARTSCQASPLPGTELTAPPRLSIPLT